jgi:ADP-dependent NAD(P)H-hydrate dehydratase / NAD(P)H-hydrate epimerase
MVILSAGQIRDWDLFTIEHEPILSINLMERAAFRCFEWLHQHGYSSANFHVYCGKGNNGGDGLALARILRKHNISVDIFIVETGQKGTDNFQINLARLQEVDVAVSYLQFKEDLHTVPHGHIVIDALFGTGINRPIEGIAALIIQHINESGNEIISIDMPSGLSADTSSKGYITVEALHTLSFECNKLAFMLAENAAAIGQLHLLPIGLHPLYLNQIKPISEIVDAAFIQSIYKPRKQFTHKGSFGHALLVAGSYGKIGAAVLCTKACLRSGAGLATAFIPRCGYAIVQSSVPEAMVITDTLDDYLSESPSSYHNYKTIGMGPGMGTHIATRLTIENILLNFQKPVVIDADALNSIAADNKILKLITAFSILTPHPKEFDRLFGHSENDFERLQLAIEKAKEWNVIIVLKGHHTIIVMPGGRFYFNNTGNAGMATGGSGDVLTGIITALLSQSYTPEEAALMGVCLHGMAGDIAAEKYGEESLIATDIIENIGGAFLKLRE